jgi:hypothetical protein
MSGDRWNAGSGGAPGGPGGGLPPADDPPGRRARKRVGRRIAALLPLVVLGAVVVFVLARRERGARIGAALPFGKATQSVVLYYVGTTSSRLAPERREIAVGGGGRVRAVVEALLAGSRTGLRDPFPGGSPVLGAYADGKGGVVVDLAREAVARKAWSATEEALAIGALVKTIGANVPGVSRVTILIEGEPAATLAGHVDLRSPIAIRDWWQERP